MDDAIFSPFNPKAGFGQERSTSSGGGDAVLSFRHFMAGRRNADPVPDYSDWHTGDVAIDGASRDVPRRADWQRKVPAEVGINPQSLKDAIDFAIASEVKNPRDLKLNHYRTFGREPSDRRLQHLALVRLRQWLDCDRRAAGAVGDRRGPLGRRHVHQRL